MGVMGQHQGQCDYCAGSMWISKLTCSECGSAHEGMFFTPGLFRLSREEQRFIELFVLSSGSLKKMAELLGLSYPTVRNRLDRVIDRLREEQQRDQALKRQVLDDIDHGRIRPKEGMRMIDAL